MKTTQNTSEYRRSLGNASKPTETFLKHSELIRTHQKASIHPRTLENAHKPIWPTENTVDCLNTPKDTPECYKMAQNCQLPSTTQNPCERLWTPQNTPEFKERQRTTLNPWECLTIPQSTPEGHKEHHRFFETFQNNPELMRKSLNASEYLKILKKSRKCCLKMLQKSRKRCFHQPFRTIQNAFELFRMPKHPTTS